MRGAGVFELRAGTSDAAVVAQVFGDRNYELDRFAQGATVRAAADAIRGRGLRPLILDLGANVGASSRWFVTAFPDARVVAVEPDPDNVAMCRRNTAGRDVIVVEAAIGSHRGVVELEQRRGDEWGTRSTRLEAGSSGVPIVTVGELVEEYGVGYELLLVKVDIEGFERDLFAQSTQWVNDVAALIIEPHDWMLPAEHSSREFQRVLGDGSFDLLIAGDNLVYVRADDGAGLR